MTRRQLLAISISALRLEQDSWLAYSIRTKEERNHFASMAPICFGSILKPFLAAAYASTHEHFPQVLCQGLRSGCWCASGHGPQDIVSALANSCNTYFLKLAAGIDRAALDETALSFGLTQPARSLSGAHLIGLSSGWPQTPVAVTHAFALLAQRVSNPSVRLILQGLAKCARSGTARQAGFPCYAKTGTAPCSHIPQAPGDGFAVAIYPLDQPRWILLVRSHSTTGAHAAGRLKELSQRIGLT